MEGFFSKLLEMLAVRFFYVKLVTIEEEIIMSNRFGENISWISEGDTLKLGGRGVIKKPPKPETNWKKLEINEGILGIDHSAFAGFVSLEEVELPKSLIMIGEYAFADCWNLAKIGPLPSLNYIEKNAFEHSGCHSLTKALNEAGPTLVPFSNRIFTRYGNVRLDGEMHKAINGKPLKEQLSHFKYAVTSDPTKEDAEEYLDIQFENLYKIIMDGNCIIGVVLTGDSRETDTWLFANKHNWEPLHGSAEKWVRIEFNL